MYVPLAQQRRANLTAVPLGLVILVDRIVEHHDVRVFVNNFVVADDLVPRPLVFRPLWRAGEDVAGSNGFLDAHSAFGLWPAPEKSWEDRVKPAGTPRL